MTDTPRVTTVNMEDEMRNSFMDYAMSVIISRALPDARDGLKPVHRRILYTMYRLHNTKDQSYVKSARVIGDTMGKLHPHGDSAIYEALVRMAQDFSLRYCLVDGQGNFGSIDGDPPAAMRYTEVRMERLSDSLLADIDQDTVDMIPNYDDKDLEPAVLPSRFPNLFVNGASGIAVGMATKIPPHNMGEMIRATKALLDNPQMTTRELMAFVPGPDFPTGGIIYGRAGIRTAYETGRGTITVRAKTEIEELPGGRSQIIVTEIPYQVNKARMLESIADHVKDKKIEGISDIRDESDRHGIRVVIALKKDVQPEVLLNNLYKMRWLQTSYGMNLIAIVDRRPKMLTLKSGLAVFLRHRREVVVRRTRYLLDQAMLRRELVEGLGLAAVEIDLVVHLIRTSKDRDEAKSRLMEHAFGGLAEFLRRAGQPEDKVQQASDIYHLSERQTKAILEMRLQNLTGLQQEKLAQEYGELCVKIAEFELILSDEERLKEVIRSELDEILAAYDDARRTEIVDRSGEINPEDLIADEDMVVTMTTSGYVKRTPLSEFRAQQRGGKGRSGVHVRAEDELMSMFIGGALAHVLLFTDRGRVFSKRVYEIPQRSTSSQGKALVNLIEMQEGERVVEMLPVGEFEENRYVVTATRNGIVKKTELQAFSNVRSSGIIAVVLDEDDSLIEVRITDGNEQVVLATAMGQGIRFLESQIRSMGRVSRGVKGMTLRTGDRVVSMTTVLPESDVFVLTVTERGYGKLSPLSQFPVRHRGGVGVLTARLGEKFGEVVALRIVEMGDQLMLITTRGKVIRIPVDSISVRGRVTTGVTLVKTDSDEAVNVVARIPFSAEDEDDEGEGGEQDGESPEGSLTADTAESDGDQATDDVDAEMSDSEGDSKASEGPDGGPAGSDAGDGDEMEP
ncbi:MAG: DNA gyrase subunit A [Deltaproteobacteria bacterium]|nr:DNA gyrase subunit A [Deltaproteobacteria bacterium]